jgi:hypothetical protein
VSEKICTSVTSATSTTNRRFFQLVLRASSFIPALFSLSRSSFLSLSFSLAIVDWLDNEEAHRSIGQHRRILNSEVKLNNHQFDSKIRLRWAHRSVQKSNNMDENSSSFVQMHRDDSGYDSSLMHHEFSSPQQSTTSSSSSSSTYYSYSHVYHPHLSYANTSFHTYEQLIGNQTMYNSKSPHWLSCQHADLSNTIDYVCIRCPIGATGHDYVRYMCIAAIADLCWFINEFTIVERFRSRSELSTVRL